MNPLNIQFKASVKKDLKNIPNKIIKSIFLKIIALQENPHPSEARKLMGTENVYRIRVGDYRIIYDFNKKKSIITVLYIRHRKTVYSDF